jgi:predicted dehydrogenase
MDPIAIGLIGCGGMGRRHLRAYAAVAGVSPDEFKLVAVCDPRPGAASPTRRYTTWSPSRPSRREST